MKSPAKFLLSWQLWLRMLIAFIFPYLIFSILLKSSSISVNNSMNNDEKIELALFNAASVPDPVMQQLKQVANIRSADSKEQLIAWVNDDTVDVGLSVGPGFDSLEYTTATVDYYINSMNSNPASELLDIIDAYEDQMIALRLQKLEFDQADLNPVVVRKNNAFSPFDQVGRIIELIKGSVSTIVNLLFVLFVLWLLRYMILQFHEQQYHNFWAFCGLCLSLCLLSMLLVFVGFYKGINVEIEGMLRSVVLSLNMFFSWQKMHLIFWLWLPTWLAIMGLIGGICVRSTAVKAYNRSFWVVIVLHLVAFYAMTPTQSMSLAVQAVPLVNTFAFGQLVFKGIELGNSWWLCLSFSCFWAVLFNYWWYRGWQKRAN